MEAMADAMTGIDKIHCEHGALTNTWGWFVQGLLALVAFSSLIVKRFCEPKQERRPWLVWFFDTSKQALGALLIHFANVYLSDVFKGDPCTWYVISFLLDSTLGLIIIYVGLRLSQYIFVKQLEWTTLKLGEYGKPGKPPQCNAWVGQCGLYLFVMIVEKILVTLFIQFKFWRTVRKFIMSPIKNSQVEVVLVMLVIPVIVNSIMFWVVDNFLMRKRKKRPKGMSINSSVKYRRAASGESDSDHDILLSPVDDHDGIQQRHLPTPESV